MSDLHLTNFDVHRDRRGVMTAILNVADQPVNVFNENVLHDLDELLLAVEHDDTVKGIVFRSGKENGFLAGADLRSIEALKTPEEAKEICQTGQGLFQRLERLTVPTIAVINGVCLGGGLEFVLACRYRIVVDDPRTKLGFPEVELGLLPAWGGTQRLPSRVGLNAALPMLLTGKKVGAEEACRIGLAEVVCRADEVDATVARLLQASAERHSQKSVLAWFLDHSRIGQWLVMRLARRGIAKDASNYPALPAILAAVSAGIRDRSGRGFAVECEEFGRLMMTRTHHSLLGLFFQRERARKVETWVPCIKAKPRRVRKVGVVGGGVMGAGIAYWTSTQGFAVVLKEINSDLLDASLRSIRELFDESVRRKALSASDAAAKFSALTATTDWQAFADIDLVIEAVPERLDTKQTVFSQLEQHCPSHAVLTSNTSSLSIRAISETIRDSGRVLGLHFFNPVHRMQLVEVVRTEFSHDEDVALLVEFVKKLGKVPLVTSDRPGFVVNRILFPYLDEAIRLHCDGVPTDTIDRTLKQFGMPMGPLELLDQVGLDIAAHVADSLKGLCPESSPTGARLHEMVVQGNIGRKAGRGFYVYLNGGKRKGRAVASTAKASHVSAEDIRDRIVLRLVNEAAKCLQERFVSEPWMIDLGMVLGSGFAPFLGGPLQMCEQRGSGAAVAKLEYFQKTLGQRFAPAQWLIDQSENAAKFLKWNW